MPTTLGNVRPRLSDHGHMTKTAGKKPTTKPKRSHKPAPVGPEIVFQGTTSGGYSFIIMGEGRGTARRYWWWCCGCWEGCVDNPASDLETMQEEYALHMGLCPGQLSTARVSIVRYVPVPGCQCGNVASA